MMMLSAHFQEAFPSSCHYCTFWSVRRRARPTVAARVPRIPKTSKGILQFQQLFSGVNGPVEREPELTPVQEPPVHEAAQPEPQILVNEETENIQDSLENSEVSGQNDAHPEEGLPQGEEIQSFPPEAESDSSDVPFGVLQDHVYRLHVSLSVSPVNSAAAQEGFKRHAAMPTNYHFTEMSDGARLLNGAHAPAVQHFLAVVEE